MLDLRSSYTIRVLIGFQKLGQSKLIDMIRPRLRLISSDKKELQIK